MRFLGFLVSVYMMIIFIRIMLTWFSWERNSGFMNILSMITDPYLAWFRRFSFLRAGYIDFSPIAALAVLSLLNRVFYILASYGTISFGIILAMVLQVVWGIISFAIGFLIIILILQLIFNLIVQNSANTFWKIINSISQPVLFRVNRLIFKNRIVNYMTGIIVSLAGLFVIYLILKVLVSLISGMLVKLPI